MNKFGKNMETENSVFSVPMIRRWLKEKSGKTSKLAKKISEWTDLNISPSARIVDLGCGTGALSVEIAKQNTLAKVFALDINDHMDHSLEIPENLEYNNVKPFSLAECNLNPDIIILSGVIHHVSKKQEVDFIKDIGDALPVGGKLFVHEHELSQSRTQIIERAMLAITEIISNRCLETMETHYNFLSRKELNKLLEDNNFRILKEEAVGGRYVTIPQLAGNNITLAEKI